MSTQAAGHFLQQILHAARFFGARWLWRKVHATAFLHPLLHQGTCMARLALTQCSNTKNDPSSMERQDLRNYANQVCTILLKAH